MLDHHEHGEGHDLMTAPMSLLDRLKGASEPEPVEAYSLVATMEGCMRAMSEAELEATIAAGLHLFADRFGHVPMGVPQALPAETSSGTTAEPPSDPSTGGVPATSKPRRGGRLPYWIKAIDDLDVARSNGHAFVGSSWRSYPRQRASDPEGTVYVIGWADFSRPAHEQKIVHAIRKSTGEKIEITIGSHACVIDDVAFCPKVPLDPRIARGTAAFRQAWSVLARHFAK